MKKLGLLIFPIVTAALLLTACTAQEAYSEKLVPVQVATPSRGTIENRVVFRGQVKPERQVPVISRLQGKVLDVFFDVGDTVQADDVLFTMDKRDIADNIDKLKAQIATVDASVAAAETGLKLAAGSQVKSAQIQAEGAVSQTRISREQASNSYEQAKQNYENAQKLYAIGDYSQLQVDTAKTAYEQAKLARELAGTAYENAKKGAEISTGDAPAEALQRAQDAVNQAKSQRDALDVQMKIAEEALDDAQIKAPISGVISSRGVEPLAMVGTQSVPFIIVKTDKVRVDVQVTETIVALLSPGDLVDVNIESLGQDPLAGVIKTVAPAAAQTSTFPVSVELDNAQGRIKPGMFAKVSVVRAKADDAVIIPRSAVIERESRICAIKIVDGRAALIDVTTGIDDGEHIEILSGLSESDQIVVKGQAYLKDGTAVSVVQSGQEASK